VTIVTDTHPWIWFLAASPRLSPEAKACLSNPSNLIIVPLIVMLEIRYYLGQNLSNVALAVSMIAMPVNIPLKCALGSKFCSTQYSQDNNISV
jgi:hypothetical protein